MMKNSLPICFIHSGFSQHLLLAIKQARHHNPASEIFLLGDQANQHLDKLCTHILTNDSSNKIETFSGVYKHFSTNSFQFEYFCFKRWFILLEFMQQHKLDWVCTMDSDFMLYCSVEQFFQSAIVNLNVEAAYCIPQQSFDDLRWTASGHIAFVSKGFLQAFCDFVLQTYKENLSVFERKINYHTEQKLAGGICDMTLLYLYYLNNSKKLHNLLIPHNHYVFDHNINTGDNYIPLEFTTKGAYKSVKLEKGIPYAHNSKGTRTGFHGLHFQGNAKKEMVGFYYNKIEFVKHVMLQFASRIRNKIERTFL